MKIPQHIFIHHTAVSFAKNPDQWKATDAYHRSKGWGGGGYNYEVAADGSIHQFREDGAVTAAQYQDNMNDGRALSICLDMDGDIEEPTEAQKQAVKAWLKVKMAKYGISPENVYCHRKVATYKSCPGWKLPNDIYHYFIPMSSLVPPPSDWAKQSWAWLIDNQIIQKETNPSETASKEWVATVLFRLKQKKLLST
jgi:hypothetical protein